MQESCPIPNNSNDMGKMIKLSSQEKADLLQAIRTIQERLTLFDGEMTEAVAVALLREYLEQPLTNILRSHRQERLLT